MNKLTSLKQISDLQQRLKVEQQDHQRAAYKIIALQKRNDALLAAIRDIYKLAVNTDNNFAPSKAEAHLIYD